MLRNTRKQGLVSMTNTAVIDAVWGALPESAGSKTHLFVQAEADQ